MAATALAKEADELSLIHSEVDVVKGAEAISRLFNEYFGHAFDLYQRRP
jgi:hypothetical protein